MAVYWGDLHGHSKLSDGRGTPDEYYGYARDEAKLDFCALTDAVDQVVASRTGVLAEDGWADMKRAAKAFHDPGGFVTFLGLERLVPSWDGQTPGSVCVCYKADTGPLPLSRHPPRDWLRPGAIPAEPELDQFWSALKGVECLVSVNHPGSARQGFTWSRVPRKYAFDAVEVYSKWGSSEAPGAPFPVSDGVGRGSRPGGTAHDALAAGFRLGFWGGTDTRHCAPGSSLWESDWGNVAKYDRGGLTAVLAESRTREAIFEALKSRRCYAVTHERIQLVFAVNEVPMGGVVTGAEKLRVHVRAVGTRPVKRVEVFKNGEIAFRKVGGREEIEAYFDEPAPAVPTWYYARVTQTGEDFAWSSPVWVVPATAG